MIKIVSFFIQFKKRDLLKFYRLSDAIFYDRINTIYQFIKPSLDKRNSIFEEYGAFKDGRTTDGRTDGRKMDGRPKVKPKNAIASLSICRYKIHNLHVFFSLTIT